MSEPIYVLRTNEAVLKPIEKKRIRVVMQVCVWIVVAVIVVGSLIFGDNLFAELNWPAGVFLVLLVIFFGFYGGKKDYVPSPMELQFYEDRLVLYLPERYYSKHLTRRQYNILPYATITKCVYDRRLEMIKIYGDGKSIWYNYRKDGSLPEKPTEIRDVTGGMIYFCTKLATDVDFKSEIENHSPLTVTVEK